MYIGNLPYHGVTESDLRAKFSDGIGTIKDLRMREGFAFVEYEVRQKRERREEKGPILNFDIDALTE